MAKDFFDEEYEKKTEQGSDNGGSNNDSWFNRPAPKQEQAQNRRPLYIAIIAVALVLCIALGWVLCTIFQGVTFKYNTDGDGASNYGGEILETVIQYLKQRYYEDISEEEWLKAIEYSGSALMQVAGDKFSQLMAPQTYYDFVYPTTSTVASSDEVFGVSFVVEEGVGLYVSSVVANSSAYGKLQDGDIVLKLSEIVDSDGKAPVVAGKAFDEMVLGEYKTEIITTVLSTARKAKFHVLRLNSDSDDGYEVFAVDLTRQKIRPVATDYQYTFIEFYFDAKHNNVSVPSKKDAQGNFVITEGEYTTYEERHLDQLPAGTGYVRITQFMDYTVLDGGETVKISASKEFKEVMDLFKELHLTHLVLDLKGNPGGNVSYVSDVAALLVTDAKLTPSQKTAVTDKEGKLLITTLKFPKFNFEQSETRTSTYADYFGSVKDKCSIVVWTDGGSASASELLTGALTDYQTAVQMGVTTYGKGIAQTWEELPFYGTVTDLYGNKTTFPWAIYYTCASYYSPFGNNIHGEGYSPADEFNYLTNYADLWNAAKLYWNV